MRKIFASLIPVLLAPLRGDVNNLPAIVEALNSRCHGSESIKFINVSSEDYRTSSLKLPLGVLTSKDKKLELRMENVTVTASYQECFVNGSKVPPLFCQRPWVDPLLSLRSLHSVIFGLKTVENPVMLVDKGCFAVRHTDNGHRSSGLIFKQVLSRESYNKDGTISGKIRLIRLDNSIYTVHDQTVINGFNGAGGFFFWTVFKKNEGTTNQVESSPSGPTESCTRGQNSPECYSSKGKSTTFKSKPPSGAAFEYGYEPVGYVASASGLQSQEKFFYLQSEDE